MANIIESKLIEVYKHASNGGELDPKTVGKIVGGPGNPATKGEAYLKALVERWPDEFGADKDELPEDPSDDQPEPSAPEQSEEDEDEDEDDDLSGLEDFEEEEEEEEPEPEPVKATPAPAAAKPAKEPKPAVTVVSAPAAAPAITSALLLGESNQIEAKLEIVSISGGTIALRRGIPKDEVVLTLKGKQVTVDLEDLKRRRADETVHGLRVVQLIGLAEAAKA